MRRPSPVIFCSGRAAPTATSLRLQQARARRRCDARHGENRLHAVLGWSDAYRDPSVRFLVPLVALDAVVEIEGRAAGAR
jgi:hypothetical protein